jgi:phosphoribosylformylglycinamidine cyclo-ligase
MTSYRDAGVDLDGADRHVTRIASSVTATWGPQVIGAFGGFAAGVRVPERYSRPVLMMTTDGVGTKLELARRTGLWQGVGHDLVAMCVDDLAAVGARPLGLVDYMAVGALDPDRDATIVGSIAQACLIARCPLLGGETAEHPDVMDPDAVDLAATAMGVVEEGAELRPDRVEVGDVVVGLVSHNLRSNGFSLVRRVFGDDLEEHAVELLQPSVIYSPLVLDVIDGGGVHAAAHITGGGIAANLARSLPEGMGAVIEADAWEPPPVFASIAERGVDQGEMFRTFNMGIGFCLVVAPPDLGRILGGIDDAKPIGMITNSGVVALA